MLAEPILEEPTTPSLPEHEIISRILTGTNATHIHKALDLPHLLTTYRKLFPDQNPEKLYRALRQPNNPYTHGHRQAFHTPQEAIIIGQLIDGNRGAYNALLHLWADETFKDEESKKLLKLLNKR